MLHEVLVAIVGGIVQYTTPHLTTTDTGVVQLNVVIKAVAI